MCPGPPIVRLSPRSPIGKTIFVEARSDKPRSGIPERISLELGKHRRIVLQETCKQVQEPNILLISA